MKEDKLQDLDFHVYNFCTYIVGLHHSNEDGKNRYQLISKYLNSMVNPEYKYSGYSDEDMLANEYYFGEKIYEHSYSEISSIRLIVEEDNKFDKNPIKVYHNTIKDLGYVPSIHKDKVNDIINNSNIMYIELEITGGKFKMVENGVLIKGETSLGLTINIFYSWIGAYVLIFWEMV